MARNGESSPPNSTVKTEPPRGGANVRSPAESRRKHCHEKATILTTTYARSASRTSLWGNSSRGRCGWPTERKLQGKRFEPPSAWGPSEIFPTAILVGPAETATGIRRRAGLPWSLKWAELK